MATNEMLFEAIHKELNEMEALARVIVDGGASIGWEQSISLPSAKRAELVARCLELRTSIRANFLQLSLN